ncbi:putative beta-galactosidase [Streptomyces bingchenggensis BCW-1]|uniref:Beta-galactosidase n=1 Tax=Streptomyces bingchenggensis (strain BCW-1) TaxID=749414 RepID=D7BW36_STRBB|nr:MULTISPECIES: beta-galactosidase [Streptomyces]ADI11746.1 putative beta-galactosidase [Streptomyces bingchenggensis BCW-1]
MTSDNMLRFRERLNGVVFGGDYNPEQWPRDVWDEDIRLMKEAGLGMVTIGVFSWSALEPADGVFEMDWLDDVVDRLHAGGIAVDLATPNAAPPPWMAEEHPEAMMVDRHGKRIGIGSRGHFCPSSPVYRDRSLRMARKLAERYGDHPALAMWHVGNEYHAECFCKQCDERFRYWLQEKYGSIDELNSRWGTVMWSQRYSDWGQVHLPRPVRGHVNPARQLDYSRFNSDVQLDLFRHERDLLHEITPAIPVTTNFFQNVSLNDYHRWGSEVDVVAFDSYPDPGRADASARAALHYDLMRSVGGGEPWLVLEQAAGAVSQWPRNYVKQPGRMRLGSYQTMARGADAVMFFQWRASRTGQEKFHSAMLPHSGTASRTWREVSELGRELPRTATVVGARSEADVAIVWDWDNWWAVEGCFHPVNDFSYADTLLEHYTPLWEQNVAVDVVTLSTDLSRYRVLVIPNQYLITAEQRVALEEFIEGGGHVLVSYFSGIVDGDDQIITGGYPGGLRDVIGAHVLEFCPMLPETSVAVRAVEGQDLLPAGFSGRALRWQDDLVSEGAQVVAEYTDSHLRSKPAVLDRRSGDGSCVYLGTTLDTASYTAVLRSLLQRAGVAPVLDAPTGVEVTERVGQTQRFLFLLNHGAPTSVCLDRDGIDLLTGEQHRAGETVALASSGVCIIESDR